MRAVRYIPGSYLRNSAAELCHSLTGSEDARRSLSLPRQVQEGKEEDNEPGAGMTSQEGRSRRDRSGVRPAADLQGASPRI